MLNHKHTYGSETFPDLCVVCGHIRQAQKPAKRLKRKEKGEQAAVIDWARKRVGMWPCLRWLHHIPNGTHLSGDARRRAMQMHSLKAQGLVPGISDLCLPFAASGFHGLYIEMKAEKGEVREAQSEFLVYLESAGYAAAICWSSLEAIEVLEKYLNGRLK